VKKINIFSKQQSITVNTKGTENINTILLN